MRQLNNGKKTRRTKYIQWEDILVWNISRQINAFFPKKLKECNPERSKEDYRRYKYQNFVARVNFNILNPTGHVMHRQFNIQQLYVLPTLYLCVLYLSENRQRLVPLTA